MQLASRFASRSPVLRSDHPLSDDQIRAVAPSIFADAPHESRSQRYSYIPTATVLDKLRGEGFEPFMVTQTRVRQEDRRDYTKHMLRLRHASQINGREANEIILLNSHDGTSTYLRFAFMCDHCGGNPPKAQAAVKLLCVAFRVTGHDRRRPLPDYTAGVCFPEECKEQIIYLFRLLFRDPMTSSFDQMHALQLGTCLAHMFISPGHLTNAPVLCATNEASWDIDRAMRETSSIALVA